MPESRHGSGGVESAGDRVGDECPAFLRQQRQEAFLLRYQRIQPRRFPIQVIRDDTLSRKGWNRNTVVPNEILGNALLAGRPEHGSFAKSAEMVTRRDVVQVSCINLAAGLNTWSSVVPKPTPFRVPRTIAPLPFRSMA